MDSKRVGGGRMIRAAGALLVTVVSAVLSAAAEARTPNAGLAQVTYADLSVSVSDGRATLGAPGDETTYVITVTNAGPAPVVGASIEDILPPGLSGAVWGCLPLEGVTCSTKGSGDLTDQLDLPAGASAIYVLTVTLDEGAGATVSNAVNVTVPVGVVDQVSPNNSAIDVNSVGAIPSLAVSDVTVNLGSSGRSMAMVRVDLQSALPYPLTVDFTTVDDSAIAGAEYTPNSGSLTFAPGMTSQAVEVEVLPSNEGVADRRLFVDFSIASASGHSDSRATVTLAWPNGFYTVAPCRLVDTRPAGALDATTTRRFTVAGHCGIPGTARAIAANVTVADATTAGDLRVFAAGLETPEASSVNYAPGRTRAAQAIVTLSAEGEIDVFCAQATGTAELVLDIAGYFK